MGVDWENRGSHSEIVVAERLFGLGHTVLTPLLTREKYDLVTDLSTGMCRIQVKTGLLSNNSTPEDPKSIRADLRTTKGKSSERVENTGYTEDDIDAFAIYNPYHDEVYWMWFHEVEGHGQIKIYTGDWEGLPPANKARSRNSDDYLIGERV